jgi:hypothetical protein
MSLITATFIRIAAAAVIGLDCAEAAGLGHGLLPLGDSHVTQLAILLGGSFVLAEFTELVGRPLRQKLHKACRSAWEFIKKTFGSK